VGAVKIISRQCDNSRQRDVLQITWHSVERVSGASSITEPGGVRNDFKQKRMPTNGGSLKTHHTRGVLFKTFCNSIWGRNDISKIFTSFFNIITLNSNTYVTSVQKLFDASQIEFFAADNIRLSSLKFLWWASEIWFISARVTFQPFKVIQGHCCWYQSQARDFLLIRNSNLGPILHCFGDFAAFMCSWPHFIPP